MTIEGTADPVRDAFAANLDEGLDCGAAFAVVADGQTVVDLRGGLADARKQHPWRHDTIVTVQSVTKGIVALAIAMLVDRGKLDYEAPVTTWWPAFAAGGKEDITLGQIMSHQAGLNTVREDLDLNDLYHGDRFVRCLEAMEPIYPPGTMCVYHALSYGYLAGEIVRLVDGRTIGRFIADEISGPLGASCFLGLPEAEDRRAAEVIAGPGADDVMNDATRRELTRGYVNPRVRPTEPNTRAWRATEVPAGSANANALSLARIYGGLALGGSLDGVGLISPRTLALATTERFNGNEAGFGWPIRFGAGFMLNKDDVFGPHPNAFGHSGWGGYVAYADPHHRLGVGYVTNRMMVSGDQADPRRLRLLDALYDALAM